MWVWHVAIRRRVTISRPQQAHLTLGFLGGRLPVVHLQRHNDDHRRCQQVKTRRDVKDKIPGGHKCEKTINSDPKPVPNLQFFGILTDCAMAMVTISTPLVYSFMIESRCWSRKAIEMPANAPTNMVAIVACTNTPGCRVGKILARLWGFS